MIKHPHVCTPDEATTMQNRYDKEYIEEHLEDFNQFVGAVRDTEYKYVDLYVIAMLYPVMRRE